MQLLKSAEIGNGKKIPLLDFNRFPTKNLYFHCLDHPRDPSTFSEARDPSTFSEGDWRHCYGFGGSKHLRRYLDP